VKALDLLMQERAFDRELSYTKTVALALLPQSYADFNRHTEFDEAFRRWTQEDNFRGLDFARVWSLALNCEHVLEGGAGSVAELGVYQGQSAALLSLYAERFSRSIYLCDTFTGFSEKQFDDDMSDHAKAAFKDTGLESAKAVVGDYSGIRWVVGLFPDSITQEMRDDKFAFVSIDCDIYEPIYQGLKFFWPRMRAGGMIFVHDYSSGYWPGATRAVDEFCAQNGIAGCLLPDLAGTFVLARGHTVPG
jgi:O-methyltransferase